MIVLEQDGLNGSYAEGLNAKKRGFLKGIRLKDVSLKNAIKVAKVAAPIALSFIPVGGGAASSFAGKAISKLSKTGVGRVGLKIANSKTVASISKVAKSEVGQAAIKLASPLVKNAKAALLEQTGVLPNDEQLETLAVAKGTSPQQELDAIVAAAPTPGVTPAKKDNTMLYVGGGVLALGIAFVAFKK